jgi:UDP-N-acetylglucosamine 2-epimerase (non-hydrolysing)/UDP-GlcNAc3NAcA epimerase
VLIATIVGNRPQFVKAAAVSRKLRESNDELLVHTGQHHDDELSKVFFEELGIPAPDRQLNIHGGSNTDQTARMLAALAPELAELAPDLVLVYGDTNSTLAGALAGAQQRIPVAHVEAGMRSFDRAMPEELNRVLADHASDLLFCSTPTAVENLKREGISDSVHLVGDVMADVALAFMPTGGGGLQEEYVLITAHRAGNVDDPARLERLVELLERLPIPGVFPMHPRTRARLEEAGLLERAEQAVRVLPPVGYIELLGLLRDARAVMTDSGGLQKEAYLMATPCITLRDTTEWVETVDAGWNVLVDLDVDAALAALEGPRPIGERPELYGGGRAAERICDVLASYTPSG